MHPAFHQEIARSRQADLLREAQMAHLAAQFPRRSFRETLSGLAAHLPQRGRRSTEPALGIR
ncbi:MAG TPA: hypothetical protein VGJ25_05205 [Gaiellaceae bacterium]|jgi:hypothetical protein